MKYTQEYLHECFTYDYLTGDLFRKSRPRHHFNSDKAMKLSNRYSGNKITFISNHGYLMVCMNAIPTLVHRIAFMMHYGECPPCIDHIDLNPLNNRIENLRPATLNQNQHNRRKCKSNTSGYKGVSWHKQLCKWRATIYLNWKQTSLGLFDTKEEAYEAYCKAANELHKEFARVA